MKEATLVVYAREALASREVARGQNFAPDRSGRLRLRVEAVAAYVEAEAFVDGRARQPPDRLPAFEHDGPKARLAKLVGRREARGAAAYDYDRAAFSLAHPCHPFGNSCAPT